MGTLSSLSARTKDGALRVVVESPRGATCKLKYDPDDDCFTLSRPLPAGTAYPYDWGFVPGTKGPDGDPVDVLVVWDAASYPGVALACRPIAILRVEQKGKDGGRERNDRILAVPVADKRTASLKDVNDLSERVRQELEQFFLAITVLEGKEAKILGWDGAQAAQRFVDESRGKR